MKYLFSLLILLIVTTAVGREPQRGYRGFVDANVDMSFQQSSYSSGVDTYYGLSTSHGCQLNPHYFIGAGFVWEHVRKHDDRHYSAEFPYYVHFRTDWTINERFPIYGDVRVGGVLFGDCRFYLSPTVGYRFNWGRKLNLNLGMGVTFRSYDWSDEKTLHPQLSFRVGIDF